MTSHPKSNQLSLRHHTAWPKSAGFTLLEIVIVLAITALIIGGSITVMLISSSERKLSDASGEIELLAKKARAASILHQTPYAIEFRPGSVSIVPLAEAGNMERLTSGGNSIGGSEINSSSRPVLREDISIDPDIVLSIRPWNATNFITPSETTFPIWRFDPDGLSEPITVRLTIGDSYSQDTYHPLTATIADSERAAN